MAAAQKLAQEEGIPVEEAECHLDSKLFLDEYPRWKADSPQCPCILQRMFACIEEAGCKECKWTIHQGHQQPVPREEAEVKTLAVQMMRFQTTWEEVQGIYNKVYQKTGYQAPSYGPELMKVLDWEICASLEEQMQWRWSTARLKEDLRGAITQAFCGQAARLNPITGPR